MRLSADETDPGWGEAIRLGIAIPYLHVIFNGQELTNAHIDTLDTEEGWIQGIAFEDGVPVIKAGDFVRKVQHGRVEVRLLRDQDGKWPHPGFAENRQPFMTGAAALQPIDFSNMRF